MAVRSSAWTISIVCAPRPSRRSATSARLTRRSDSVPPPPWAASSSSRANRRRGSVVLLAEQRHVGRVARRNLLLGVDPVHRLVHGGRRFAEATRDELELSGIRRDVARRPHALAAPLPQLVDEDLIPLQGEPPVCHQADLPHPTGHRPPNS